MVGGVRGYYNVAELGGEPVGYAVRGFGNAPGKVAGRRQHVGVRTQPLLAGGAPVVISDDHGRSFAGVLVAHESLGYLLEQAGGKGRYSYDCQCCNNESFVHISLCLVVVEKRV